MKWVLLGFALIVVLAGCPTASTGLGPSHGKPAKALVAGAKGLFLQSGAKGMHVVKLRSMHGRDIVSSSGATLGMVNAGGTPETATFTDATGAQVQVTVTQAAQLTATYVLFTYSYAGGAGTDTLNMASGALASISVVPDNWALIFAQGSQAWYESGGGIWSCNLANGAATNISTGAPVYGSPSGPFNTDSPQGPYSGINPSVSASEPWDSISWIWADPSGNAYVFDKAAEGYTQAVAITSSGQIVDFGSNPLASYFEGWIPGTSGNSHAWIAIDQANDTPYVLLDADVYDINNPKAPATVSLNVYPIAFNPSSPGVLSIAAGTAVASSAVTAEVFGLTYLGFQSAIQTSIFSNGPQSWTVASGGVLTSYDTSSVPVVNNGIIGQVLNWQWSGGQTYAGPTLSAQTISLVQFPSGAAAQLVSDAQTIESWSVVGGVLFYTDATGTYQAAVNTATATISTPTMYSGGTVQGITSN